MFILEVSRGYPEDRYPLNGIFEFDQAKALSAHGHKIVFSALDVRSLRRWRRWGLYRREEKGLSSYIFSFPVGAIAPIASRIQKLGFRLLLNRVLRQIGQPDLVHVHFGSVAHSVARICQKKNIPYVVTEHSSAVNTDSLSPAEQKHLIETYAGAEAVVAVSQFLKERIMAHTGITAYVIPNIVDLSLFFPTDKPRTSENLRFISAGNLIPGKGFDILLDAFSQIIRKRPDARLLIMGDGPEKGALQEQTCRLGLNASVRFFGPYQRAEFAAEQQKSDIFVLASRGETFGVVYIEAMAGGLPVIATRCGGPEDFITAENGLLVVPEDPELLAEAMLRAAEQLPSYDRQRIAAEVAEHFSAANVARQLTRLFETIIP